MLNPSNVITKVKFSQAKCGLLRGDVSGAIQQRAKTVLQQENFACSCGERV